MSSRSLNVAARLDWTTLLTMGILVVLGWLNIVSATAEAEVVWDMSGKAGKQLIWMGVCACGIRAVNEGAKSHHYRFTSKITIGWDVRL